MTAQQFITFDMRGKHLHESNRLLCQMIFYQIFRYYSSRKNPIRYLKKSNLEFKLTNFHVLCPLLQLHFHFRIIAAASDKKYSDYQIKSRKVTSNLLQISMKEFFKVPDAQYRKTALGSLPGLPYRVKKSIEQVLPFFQPINKPKQSDWLWDHEEEGQSYDAYNGQMHNIVDKKRNVIYIKPLDASISQQFLQDLKQYCQCFFYPMKVSILKPTNILDGVERRINQYTEKEQLHARQILKKLEKSLKPDAFCLIGVSLIDLYPRDQWNYVFGIASIRQRTGVFSFARYDQRFFTDQIYETDYHRIFWRALGVMTHEITHMFGVRHCIFYNCLMNGSNHLEEAERKPHSLCPICLRKLQSNIKFDILERYQQILKFVQKKEDQRAKKLLDYLKAVTTNIEGAIKLK